MPKKASNPRQTIAILLGFFAASGPAVHGWFWPGAVPVVTALTIAALGGAIAGRLLVPSGERMRAHAVAIVCGAIAGVGAYGATAWWLRGSESVMWVVLLLVAFVGAAPGVILGKLGFARLRRPVERVPQATARSAGPRSP